MEEAELILEDMQEKMQRNLEFLKQNMSQIRSGRASAALVEDIKVEVYGQNMPLNQLATINIPEPRQITLDVWDKSNLQSIEKSIQASGRSLNPQIDGGLIRIHLPELNEENRRELVKLAKQKLEEHKVGIRSLRRDGNEQLKKIKDSISEDDLHDYQTKIQSITDKIAREMEDIQKSKETEIMTI